MHESPERKSLLFIHSAAISVLVLWLTSGHNAARQLPKPALFPSSLNFGMGFVLCVCMCFKAAL